MKKRVVFLGDRELGYKSLKWLLEDGRFVIVGLVWVSTPKYSYLKEEVIDLARKYKLDIIDESELANIEFDIGVSVNYNKIIDESILKLALCGFWNIHHSYNLRLRGRNITTHAILNSHKEHIYYHGTTLHKMVPQLDSGGIVASQAVKIDSSDTAYTLFKKVDEIAFDLFKEWIPRIAFETIFTYNPPNEGVLMFRDKDLPSKEIPKNLTDDQKYDYVRAFDFPGYDPAYTCINGEKIELVVNERENYNKRIRFANKDMFTKSRD